MKKLLVALVLSAAVVLVPFAAQAKTSITHVHGYTTKSGHYIAPYVRTSSNHTKVDNWSTKGNINPFTGKKGTKSLW